MALKHVLIGILAYTPRSGYSLHKVFWDPLRPALPQIYRAINDMLHEGLITLEKVDQKGLPAKNVCTVTKEGYAELDRWLSEPPKVQPIREPFLQQLMFAARLNPKKMKGSIRVYSRRRAKELEYYKSRGLSDTSRVLEPFGSSLDGLCQSLVVDYMKRRGEFELDWARAAIESISKFQAREKRTP